MTVMPNSIRYFNGKYAFLSNFWIDTHGMSVEHKFQAAKTDDPVQVVQIMHARSPGEAKRLGRLCDLRGDWEEVKDAVMLVLLREKFTAPSLRHKLIRTERLVLVEGNTWGDMYWGKVETTQGEWTGKNVLGKLLMQVRNEVAASMGISQIVHHDR